MTRFVIPGGVKEPRRLLSEGGTSPLERSLLSAGRARREREGSRERVWGAVGVAVAGGAAVASASGTAGASAGAGAGAVTKGAGVAVALTKMKLIVAGAVIATATAGSAAYVATKQPVSEPAPIVQTARIAGPSAAAVARAQAARRDENVVAAAELPDVAEVKEAPARASTSTSTSARAKEPALSVSELREEAAMLGEVRASLASGDAAGAASRLQAARTRFPKSRLGQERDALEIRIANASGDRARAATLARAFVARYPDSPLRAGIEPATLGE